MFLDGKQQNKFPNAGGVSYFVTLTFGQKAGALVGWFFLLSVPIGAPVAALTGAGYMTAAMGWGEGARIGIKYSIKFFPMHEVGNGITLKIRHTKEEGSPPYPSLG
ncbi:amino acid transporter [Paenibacillus forsythiae]|uniref:Amino acid transporter n=1 Tax=Paenibacillus forsythiae TaxID=365616 RepID=A0ABU3H4T3_9BACL|nr:amino acid transporter [Paenibacillus forsythiae]